MNPGAIEETGKVATGIIDALKTQPAVLALIIISFALMGYIYYEGHSFNTGRQEMLKIFIEQQREVNQLLARCIVPDKTGGLKPSLLWLPPLPKTPELPK